MENLTRVKLDSARGQVHYKIGDGWHDCEYVKFDHFVQLKNSNAELNLMPQFQNDQTGEIGTCLSEYPDWIQKLFKDNCLTCGLDANYNPILALNLKETNNFYIIKPGDAIVKIYRDDKVEFKAFIGDAFDMMTNKEYEIQ